MTLDAALKMSNENRIEEWVHQYLLQAHPTGNKGLSDGLKLIKRYWTGPIKIDFAKLIQGCGPSSDFIFHEDENIWNIRIKSNISMLEQNMLPPPIIVEYKDNKLHIADGNHRFASMRDFGIKEYWGIIWFNSEEDYREYLNIVNSK